MTSACSAFRSAITSRRTCRCSANQSLNPAQPWLSVFTLAKARRALDPTTILASQPKGPNGNPMLPNGVAPNVLPLTSDNTMRLPVVDAWNFTLEHQFTPSTVFSVGYVGNKGYHVTPGGTNYNINQPTIVGFGTLTTNQRRLFLPEVRLDAEHQILQRRCQREVQLAAGSRREALHQRPAVPGQLHLGQRVRFRQRLLLLEPRHRLRPGKRRPPLRLQLQRLL